MMKRFLCGSILAYLAFVSLGYAQVDTIQVREDFTRDPGWDAVNNRLIDLDRPIVRQNFGWRQTDLAGGAPGEIGGVVWRSVRPAYYGKMIDTLTLEDPLECSGSFSLSQVTAVNQWHTGSAIWVGFFNSAEHGWWPVNFFGFQLLGQRDYEYANYAGVPVGAMVTFGYGTSEYAAVGVPLEKQGAFQGSLMRDMDHDKILRLLPDGVQHTWKMTYDPKGADGEGEIQFILDGREPLKTKIPKLHRKHGATFNRFGIFNEALPGYPMTGFFDDITVNGKLHDFSEDPGWQGVGNQVEFIDEVQYGTNDFGYSSTNFAGGEEPGEFGGRIWQAGGDQPHLAVHYAADVGQLSLDHKLFARGKVAFPTFGVDAAMQFGWFNAEDQLMPTKNFIGVYLDSYSNIGRFMTPSYGSSKAEMLITPEGRKQFFGSGTGGVDLAFVCDGRVYDWILSYEPEANEGHGVMTLTLDDQSETLNLKPGAREEGAVLNRFGVFNAQGNNGKFCVVYMDDVEFTAQAQ
jgi:hypothetical protein